jgi:hypothetical protein
VEKFLILHSHTLVENAVGLMTLLLNCVHPIREIVRIPLRKELCERCQTDVPRQVNTVDKDRLAINVEK